MGTSRPGIESEELYLDFAGAGIPDESQIKDATQQLQLVPSNPHSSPNALHDLNTARNEVLRFFNAKPGAYECIFTCGATAALHLVADSLQWTKGQSTFFHTVENHTGSEYYGTVVCLIRPEPLSTCPGCALEKALAICRAQLLKRMFSLDDEGCSGPPRLEGHGSSSGRARNSCVHLLALPAECNLTGLRCSTSTIRQLLLGSCHWTSTLPGLQEDSHVLVLLDAAKGAQTRPPDLSAHPVHFAVCSFYKIFGYPTGLGALLVRTDCMQHLHPQFPGGGTITQTLPSSFPAATEYLSGPGAFEPGTVHFQGVAALRSGFAAWRAWSSKYGPGAACAAADECAAALQRLHCTDGCTCVVYRDARDLHIGADELLPEWGPTVAFNCWDAFGRPIGCHHLQQLLQDRGIRVRAGCCCNPGACASVLGYSDSDLREHFASGMQCGGQVSIIRGRHIGVVRVSFGFSSTSMDVSRLVAAVVDICCDASCSAALSLSQAQLLVHQSRLQGIDSGVKASSDACCGQVMNREQQIGACVRAPVTRLVSILVYPLKSCGGQSESSWPLSAQGLLLDRAFVLVDTASRPLTSTRHPDLARLTASVDLAQRVLLLRWRRTEGDTSYQLHGRTCGARGTGDGCSVGEEEYSVPLPRELCPCKRVSGIPCERCQCTAAPEAARLGTELVVTCSGGRRQGARVVGTASDGVHSWVSQRIGQHCFVAAVTPAAEASPGRGSVTPRDSWLRWLHFGDVGQTVHRCQREPNCVREECVIHNGSFSNRGAVLAASTASTQQFISVLRCRERDRVGSTSAVSTMTWPLDARGASVFVAHQFRVNLLWELQGAHTEDLWATVAVPRAGVEFNMIAPAVRCAAVNTAWEGHCRTAQKSALSLLHTYRCGPGGVTWGVYMQPRLQELRSHSIRL